MGVLVWKVVCPRCGSGDVRRSIRQRGLDWLFVMFSMIAYRCRCCGGRFWKRIPQAADESEEE